MKAFNHPFNDKRCAERLLWEYNNYDKLIVGVDFDNTIKPIDESSSCQEVIELLQRCSKDPKITLCLWSVCLEDGEEQRKVDYCKSLGIKIDYVNESPLKIGNGDGKKQCFNVLLDDRAGLESAYNNLTYVLNHASIKFNKTREE